MSDLREEILGTGINKKKIIGIILVALLLIGMFAFSTVFISFLFGTQRPYPSKEKSETDPEDAELIKPPFPFDEDFWQDLLDQVDDPEALLDMLSEMFDGDIDDLDLGNFSQGLLDLLFSGAGEIEVFRVYNMTYYDFNQMFDVLWKYECFDEYTGEGWTSNAGTDLYDFYTYGDYLSNYFPDPELLKVKMPLSPDIGINSMVIPTLFPTPFVIDGSFSAPNLIPASPTLYKDEYNSTIIDLSFSSDIDANMTFNMFGLYNHLPSDIELNSTAVEAFWTPTYIENKYLQLPPTISIYKSNNPYFNAHFSILNGIIDPNDNAFWAACKIRNYLQTQFSFPLDPSLYNPAPEGTDVIEWFCETEQGVWSDFASAFCAFARAFGISSRFVDGFNSFWIEEFADPYEPPNENVGFAIKYKNLYNWAEIYVPTDISGNGKWVQFDIFDTFGGGGGGPILGGDYNITVSTDQTSYIRPDTATITATISSNTDPINNLTITFRDYTTGRIFGQDDTDISGIASIQSNFNISEIVGPHLIEARYDLFTAGYN
ncbi:MAG: transglutaminase family protein, partial [Candidatus Thorarchaeota archaeon]